MKWIRLDNGDWQAQWKEGDFLVFKWGNVWKARYRSKDHKRLFFMPVRKLLAPLKKMCEDNEWWEKER